MLHVLIGASQWSVKTCVLATKTSCSDQKCVLNVCVGPHTKFGFSVSLPVLRRASSEEHYQVLSVFYLQTFSGIVFLHNIMEELLH